MKNNTLKKFPKPFINTPIMGIDKTIYLDKTQSTQDVAKALADAGETQTTLIVAKEQTKGHGRLGKHWESPKGGAYFSVILHPSVSVDKLAQLSQKTANAICETLKQLYGFKTRVKLPNDVFVFNKAKKKFSKISGVLVESSTSSSNLEWAVLGVGININNTPSKDIPNGVSVKNLIKRDSDIELFIKTFFDKFWPIYSTWELISNSQD
jgi:BirA family transcriptional regulator, biotin operon repressor / biotin---[acetyl-CoA-carboxylase] ligase